MKARRERTEMPRMTTDTAFAPGTPARVVEKHPDGRKGFDVGETYILHRTAAGFVMGFALSKLEYAHLDNKALACMQLYPAHQRLQHQDGCWVTHALDESDEHEGVPLPIGQPIDGDVWVVTGVSPFYSKMIRPRDILLGLTVNNCWLHLREMCTIACSMEGILGYPLPKGERIVLEHEDGEKASERPDRPSSKNVF